MSVFTRLAVLLALCLKPGDEILECVRGLLEDLMKERPEEAKRSPLEFIAAAVEEE